MACIDNKLSFKKGANVAFSMKVFTPESTPDNEIREDITDWFIYIDFVSIKTGKLLFSASVEDGAILITDGLNGEYSVNAGVSTDWDIGNMPVDIKYVVNEIATYTTDFIVEINTNRTIGAI